MRRDVVRKLLRGVCRLFHSKMSLSGRDGTDALDPSRRQTLPDPDTLEFAVRVRSVFNPLDSILHQPGPEPFGCNSKKRPHKAERSQFGHHRHPCQTIRSAFCALSDQHRLCLIACVMSEQQVYATVADAGLGEHVVPGLSRTRLKPGAGGKAVYIEPNSTNVVCCETCTCEVGLGARRLPQPVIDNERDDGAPPAPSEDGQTQTVSPTGDRHCNRQMRAIGHPGPDRRHETREFRVGKRCRRPGQWQDARDANACAALRTRGCGAENSA